MFMLQGAKNVTIVGGMQVAAVGSNVTVNYADRPEANTAFKDLSMAAAHAALHNSAARFDAPRCYRNTRVKYLDKLELWMLGLGKDFEGKHLVWVNGGAGAGKSAIMQSIVDRCARHAVILGTFFFSRTDPSRNHVEVLIPTLAYQVAQAFPQAMEILGPIIQRNPLIFTASLHTQALELLVQPLLYLIETRVLEDTSPHLRVFVIDGLDECLDPEKQKQALVIQIVASILRDYHLPVAFLIASRPELAISNAFHKEHTVHEILVSITLDDDDDVPARISTILFKTASSILSKCTHSDITSQKIGLAPAQSTHCYGNPLDILFTLLQ